MTQEINSKVIGQLKQHNKFTDWWTSQNIAVPFFDNKKFIITFMDFVPENDKAFIVEADQALANFLKLNAEYEEAISELAYKHCMDFLDYVGFDEADESLKQIKDANEIWNYIYPTNIYVKRRPRRDKDIYIAIGCNCEWEQEHGFQLIFRKGEN